MLINKFPMYDLLYLKKYDIVSKSDSLSLIIDVTHKLCNIYQLHLDKGWSVHYNYDREMYYRRCTNMFHSLREELEMKK